MKKQLLFIVISLASFFSSTLLAQPWLNDLIICKSTDGVTFTNHKLFQDSAGVPNIIKLNNGRLVHAFQWFPAPINGPHWDSVYIKISDDTATTWTAPTKAVFTGMNGYTRPYDPTLVLTDDNKIRMYFSSSATGTSLLDTSVHTYSAISTDGINYVFEPGIRFRVAGQYNIDPSVTKLGSTWHYTSPVGGPAQGAYHAIATDGLNYTRLSDITSDGTHQWTGNLMVSNTTNMRFYGSSGTGISWYSSTTDGTTWSPYSPIGVNAGDPAVVQISNNLYYMIYVGNATMPVSANALICSGGSTQLSASSMGAGTNYSWQPSNGLNAITGAIVTASPTTTTTYSITGSNTTFTVTAFITVQVVSTLTLSVSNNITVCKGVATTLTAAGATSYVWSPPSGLSSTIGSSVTISEPSSSTYSVTGSANGCSGVTKQVSLLALESPSDPIIAGTPAICPGSSTTLKAILDGVTFLWSNGSTNSKVSFYSTGTYSLTVIGSNNCTNTIAFAITAAAIPTLTVTQDSTVCSGYSVTLTASGASTYSWSNGGIASLGGTLVVAPSSTTTYTATGTNSSGCSSKATVTIATIPSPTITISGTTTLCRGSSMNLDASGASSYTWNPATTPSTGASVVATPTITTTYTVTGVSLTNDCIGTAKKTITVLDCSGIDELNFVNSVSIYPNPANALILIDYKDFAEKIMNIRLVDVLGKTIVLQTNNFNVMDVSQLEEGIYSLIITGEKSTINRGIVVQK